MITSLCSKDNMQISTNDKNKILEIFEKIESVLPHINGDHKRVININFILKYKNIPISRARFFSVIHWKSLAIHLLQT